MVAPKQARLSRLPRSPRARRHKSAAINSEKRAAKPWVSALTGSRSGINEIGGGIAPSVNRAGTLYRQTCRKKTPAQSTKPAPPKKTQKRGAGQRPTPALVVDFGIGLPAAAE